MASTEKTNTENEQSTRGAPIKQVLQKRTICSEEETATRIAGQLKSDFDVVASTHKLITHL